MILRRTVSVETSSQQKTAAVPLFPSGHQTAMRDVCPLDRFVPMLNGQVRAVSFFCLMDVFQSGIDRSAFSHSKLMTRSPSSRERHLIAEMEAMPEK